MESSSCCNLFCRVVHFVLPKQCNSKTMSPHPPNHTQGMDLTTKIIYSQTTQSMIWLRKSYTLSIVWLCLSYPNHTLDVVWRRVWLGCHSSEPKLETFRSKMIMPEPLDPDNDIDEVTCSIIEHFLGMKM